MLFSAGSLFAVEPQQLSESGDTKLQERQHCGEQPAEVLEICFSWSRHSCLPDPRGLL